MKQISNWFIPPFLRRLDAYLLRNYPVVWRTKAVFVLFYGIVAAYIIAISTLSTISRNNFQPPFTEAFYGIQLLGLAAALLTTYIRSLPKTE